MPNNLLIMPILFIILALIPMRLSALQLKGLAFFLWFTGGLFLAWRGASLLFQVQDAPGWAVMALIVVLALVIGLAKGKFVLSKTSRRNIERLNALNEPMRPIYVYSLRSWLIIAVMVGISVVMNVLEVRPLIRGPINLGIGAGLIISSLAYLRALGPEERPTYPDESPHMDPGGGL